MTTVNCLVDLIDEITKTLSEESFVISILLDLSKAFDTVNHSILLSKLDVYGIRRCHWNSVVYALLNKKCSLMALNLIDFLKVNSGVPQGSSLGPVPFLVCTCTNDIVSATNYSSIRLFADDTSLTVTGNDLDLLLQRINSELPAIYNWLCRPVSWAILKH